MQLWMKQDLYRKRLLHVCVFVFIFIHFVWMIFSLFLTHTQRQTHTLILSSSHQLVQFHITASFPSSSVLSFLPLLRLQDRGTNQVKFPCLTLLMQPSSFRLHPPTDSLIAAAVQRDIDYSAAGLQGPSCEMGSTHGRPWTTSRNSDSHMSGTNFRVMDDCCCGNSES